MTKYPNREALRKAHDIYRDAMRSFIVRCLRKVRGEQVEDLIRDSLPYEEAEQFKEDLQEHNGNIEAAIDIKHFPHIIRKYWHRDRVFSQQFNSNSKVQYKTGTIMDGRNLWAHPGVEDLDSERTRAALTHVAEVLGEINNRDAEREVEDIRDRLFSHEEEEHPIEVENADLKERLAEMSNQLEAMKTEKADCEKRLEAEKAEYEELLDTVEKEKIEIEKQLNEPKAGNVALEKLPLESKNRPKTVSDQLRTVEIENAGLEERYETTSIQEWRRKIWKQLCDYTTQKGTPVRFQKPGSENYLNVSRGLIDLTGFKMNVWLGKNNREIAIRLYMSKQNFYILKKQRKEIEQEFCESLEWEKLPQRRESRISLRKGIIDPTDESDWQNQYEWVISKLEKFHKRFNEVFLPRIQELNTSDSLSEDEEYLPLNPATPNSITFQGTTFTRHLNKYHVTEDDISQNFWHYWHSQGRDGKQEMRDAGWSVEKVNGDWEVTISAENFQAWIEDEVSELSNLINPSQSAEPLTRSIQPSYEKISLPTGKEMVQPALRVLADGREHRRVEIINVLTDHFSLTKNQREQLSRSGKAEVYLRTNGLIERTRTGYYRITTRGRRKVRTG